MNISKKDIPCNHPVSDIATIKQESSGDVILTLRKEKFEDFLLGFMGSKETLSKQYKSNFILEMEYLLQFHFLLMQKIEKEQFISLSLLTTTFSYDDNSKRTINTFDALQKYLEHKNVGINSLEMKWNFLFKMPQDGDIQQQTVILFFDANNGIIVRGGSINVRIHHTNQLWASEVLRLFEENIAKVTNSDTFFYRCIAKAKKIEVFNIILIISIIILIFGGAYIYIQMKDFLSPLTVEDEFIWDLARVVEENMDSKDYEVMLLQFFLIKDLKYEIPKKIEALMEIGYFHPKYSHILKRLIDGYYKSEKKSFNLIYTAEAIKHQLEVEGKIIYIYSYLKFVLLYVTVYIMLNVYLILFKKKSIIALTNKGIKELQSQLKTKSIKMQLAYGILTSLIAASIYEYSIRILLFRFR